jgi:hypothetical protein
MHRCALMSAQSEAGGLNKISDAVAQMPAQIDVLKEKRGPRSAA